MPKISVIVPVYNTEKYLARCIESILAQTFTDFELLLIDDGSKDNSGTICDEYAAKDSRVRVFHKENGGVSSARNMGLDNASGEWITFVDSDDIVYNCWLDNYDINDNETNDIICQAIETNKPICEGSCKRNYGIEYNGGGGANFIDKLCKELILGYTTIKAFRYDIIKKTNLRFDVRCKYKEDELFVLEYIRYCKKCKSVNKIGYFYFVPDWNKYILDFKSERLIYSMLFCEAQKLKIVGSYYWGEIREALSDVYVREFKKNHYNRRQCIDGLKEILKIDYRNSQIFFITKFFIRYAPYPISSVVLLLHLSVKYGCN